MRLSHCLRALLFGLLLSTAALGKAPQRKLERRTVEITDESLNTIVEVHLAGRVPTILSFDTPLKPDSVILADGSGAFPKSPQVTAKTILLLPGKDLDASTVSTLAVTLVDGTVLPFVLRTVPGAADLEVQVALKLDKAAPADSLVSMKRALGQLRSELDECTANTANAAVQKVAGLILQEDASKPQTVERHAVHRLDRQSRLLVEVKQAYRLFGSTYVVLTVENRDPLKPWVLERPEVSVTGDGQSASAKVTATQMEMASIGPGETSKLVVAFATPSQSVNQMYVLSLFEKNGNRHVRLEGTSL